jgi:hypothetical protein
MHTIKAHASTVPKNGDVNPYGVAVVPHSAGELRDGNVLVSNFNNAQNLQGTGTTIVQVSPGDGSVKLFAQINANQLPGPCPGGVGLTTALVVLRAGWVIVGSLPTTDGTSATGGGRLSSSPEQLGPSGGDSLRRRNQRTLGHDRDGHALDRCVVRYQRAGWNCSS